MEVISNTHVPTVKRISLPLWHRGVHVASFGKEDGRRVLEVGHDDSRDGEHEGRERICLSSSSLARGFAKEMLPQKRVTQAASLIFIMSPHIENIMDRTFMKSGLGSLESAPALAPGTWAAIISGNREK